MAVAPSKHHNMSSEDGMRPNERPAKRLKVSETPSRPNGLKPATLLNDSVSEESEIVNYGLSEDFDLRVGDDLLCIPVPVSEYLTQFTAVPKG